MAVSADIIYHCTQPNTIALTFDDGPFEYTNELLDELSAAGIHATFFINGQNWWPDLPTDPTKQAIIARAAAEGHQIASHTWAHDIPATLDGIKESMNKLDDLVEQTAGYRPKYFRAPKGDIDQATVQTFESLGYKIIQWDTDTNDWNINFNGVQAPEKRVPLVKEFLTSEFKQNRSNYLVLMHDVQKHTVKQIVPWLINNGPFNQYKFVTVAECLGDFNEGKTGAISGATVTGNRGIANSNAVTQNGITTDPNTYTQNGVTTDPNAVTNINSYYDPSYGGAVVEQNFSNLQATDATQNDTNISGAINNKANSLVMAALLLYSFYIHL